MCIGPQNFFFFLSLVFLAMGRGCIITLNLLSNRWICSGSQVNLLKSFSWSSKEEAQRNERKKKKKKMEEKWINKSSIFWLISKGPPTIIYTNIYFGIQWCTHTHKLKWNVVIRLFRNKMENQLQIDFVFFVHFAAYLLLRIMFNPSLRYSLVSC